MAGRPAKREPSRWISGMDSCQFARPREPESTSSFLLFSSLRLASLRIAFSGARARCTDPAPLTPVFLFDKRIHLEAIFTVSARPRTKHRFRLKRNNDTGSNTMKFLPRERARASCDLRSCRRERYVYPVEFSPGLRATKRAQTTALSVTRSRAAKTARINYGFL